MSPTGAGLLAAVVQLNSTPAEEDAMYRCARYGLAGAVLGVATVAYAQDGAEIVSDYTALVEIFRSLGLPGVLLYIGVQVGRWVHRLRTFTITVRLDEAQVAEIKRHCGGPGNERS